MGNEHIAEPFRTILNNFTRERPDVKYRRWVDSLSDSTGKCAELTALMVKQFPELKRVRGHYHDAFWGVREHWWCVDSAGNVVDPTKKQFPDQGGEYVPLPLGTREPIGKCLGCGTYVFGDYFGSSSICSKQCEQDVLDDLM